MTQRKTSTNETLAPEFKKHFDELADVAMKSFLKLNKMHWEADSKRRRYLRERNDNAKTIEAASRKLDKRDGIIEELRLDVKDAEKECTELTGKLKKVKTENVELAIQKNKLIDELAKMTAERDALQEKFDSAAQVIAGDEMQRKRKAEWLTDNGLLALPSSSPSSPLLQSPKRKKKERWFPMNGSNEFDAYIVEAKHTMNRDDMNIASGDDPNCFTFKKGDRFWVYDWTDSPEENADNWRSAIPEEYYHSDDYREHNGFIKLEFFKKVKECDDVDDVHDPDYVFNDFVGLDDIFSSCHSSESSEEIPNASVGSKISNKELKNLGIKLN